MTLIETLIAMGILSGGLLAVALAFAQGMAIMGTGHNQQIAKLKAAEAIESIYTARDSGVQGWNWNSIQNAPDGIFLKGAQPLKDPGLDGFINTADDGQVETETLPGADGVFGTADDTTHVLSEFARTVLIENVGTNLRRITVTLSYQVRGVTRQYQLSTLISPFS
jgi:type II secretory pathway pseudopilin PulG